MKKTRSSLIVLSIALSVVACKTTKNQEESSSAHIVELTEPIKVDLPKLKLDTTEGKALKEEAVHDSLVMNITRTPCYGQCPVFSADIYLSGLVIYNGKRFVKNEGFHTARMSADQISSIQKMITSIGYFNLKDEYDSPVTDLPTTYTTASLNGVRKTIKDRVGGPTELKALEKHVQMILDSLTWTAGGGPDRQ